ncbi:hypothetical protein [Arthrobacter psychrochitiniphilus]|uniref:Uncharacterized protein n=1 Tax=Arthrobacter psychrochitiniphilus TaxID=291045 RepID=A0A2V3DMN8_9MICC|nr:hypothetical protein [Arthrobacter psychrochitiniphilus]NYG16019.1 hypothetical protein [Arthrobacter psychrochitiniphilus]PXA64027.1 hypothetical protein CVS29_17395 [Arthrobacter psychrochitiniphilus]
MGKFSKQGALLAVGLSSLILLASGCSASTVEAVGGPTSTVSAVPAVSATPTAAAKLFSVGGSLNTKLIPGVTVKTSKGAYLQAAIDPTDKVFQYDPKLVEAGVLDQWSVEDITAAQKFMVNFALTELIDTPLNGQAETPDQWYTRNVDKFLPIWHEDLRKIIGSVDENGESTSIVTEQAWMAAKGIEYRYGADQPRMIGMEMAPTKYAVTPEGYLSIYFNALFVMSTEEGTADNQIDTNSNMQFAVLKTEDGSFVFNEANNNYSYNHH